MELPPHLTAGTLLAHVGAIEQFEASPTSQQSCCLTCLLVALPAARPYWADESCVSSGLFACRRTLRRHVLTMQMKAEYVQHPSNLAHSIGGYTNAGSVC